MLSQLADIDHEKLNELFTFYYAVHAEQIRLMIPGATTKFEKKYISVEVKIFR